MSKTVIQVYVFQWVCPESRYCILQTVYFE